jgi:predicted extracellular nuclease
MSTDAAPTVSGSFADVLLPAFDSAVVVVTEPVFGMTVPAGTEAPIVATKVTLALPPAGMALAIVQETTGGATAVHPEDDLKVSAVLSESVTTTPAAGSGPALLTCKV